MGERLKTTATQALLEEVRKQMDGATNYRIEKKLGISTQRLSDYAKGTAHADAYACAKFAEVLERDPLEVIAQVEADAAKTEERRAFWAGFPSGLRRTALGVGFAAIAGFTALGLPRGAEVETSHNVRLRPKHRHEKAPRGAFFMPCAEIGSILKHLREKHPKPFQNRPSVITAARITDRGAKKIGVDVGRRRGAGREKHKREQHQARHIRPPVRAGRDTNQSLRLRSPRRSKTRASPTLPAFETREGPVADSGRVCGTR